METEMTSRSRFNILYNSRIVHLQFEINSIIQVFYPQRVQMKKKWTYCRRVILLFDPHVTDGG